MSHERPFVITGGWGWPSGEFSRISGAIESLRLIKTSKDRYKIQDEKIEGPPVEAF